MSPGGKRAAPRRRSSPRNTGTAGEIRIGISTCLLGEPVRYDGGHKRDAFVNDVLAPFVRYVSVCPEVEIGLGTPREPIHLVEREGTVRLVGTKTAIDHTAAMRAYGKRKTRELARLVLSGYILKKDSPSCGMERVRLHGRQGGIERSGVGLYAAALLAAFPDLPVEEEGRLHDAARRDNFVERVFAYHRLQALFSRRWSTGDLVRFHTGEKLLLLAHDPATYAALARLVARARGEVRQDLANRYRGAFMRGLRTLATTRKHVNVLQHAQGYLKECADAGERRDLQAVIEDFRRGLVPLVVPITLLRHLVRRHGVSYLEGQTYLEPHPKELMLRNHV